MLEDRVDVPIEIAFSSLEGADFIRLASEAQEKDITLH